MNKKKLALTLLLSSMSVAVVADDLPTVSTESGTPAAVVPSAPAPAAGTPAAVVPSAPAPAAGTPAAVVASAPAAPAQKTDIAETTPGYFKAAWSAVKSNRVATAVLVTSSILVGAAIHAAVSSNNEVEADDAE